MSALLAPWLKRQLIDLSSQKGHAWLLQGPSGLGQYQLGLELAKTWLCHQPTQDGACGVCPSCHQIDVHTHADLCVLMPETWMLDHEWPLSEKAQEDLENKKRKPSSEIRVDDLRNMVAFTQLTQSGPKSQVVLIYPADSMNTISANTLLKSLEEPAGNTRFILATDSAHQLLPTIRSRCQFHSLQWPSLDESIAWLIGQGLKKEDAEVLLRASGGRPDDALQFHHMGLKASTWSGLPQSIAKGEIKSLSDFSPTQVVEILQKICHDALIHFQGLQPRYFLNKDLPASKNFNALSQWSKDLMQISKTADHPFQAGLMLEALVSQAQRALISKV